MSSERFNRQEILGKIGMNGQRKLLKSSVAIVGVGGLGSVAAELLCRAGVGKLILIDPDSVHESNLPRQFLYDSKDIGKRKVNAARSRLLAIWPDASVDAHAVFLDAKNISLLAGADVILDGTDNLETRFLLAAYAKKHDRLFIYAGAVETRAMVFPCIPDEKMPSLDDVLGKKQTSDACGSVGIVNTASALCASIQAALTLRWIVEGTLEPLIYSINAWDGSVQRIAIAKREGRQTRKP